MECITEWKLSQPLTKLSLMTLNLFLYLYFPPSVWAFDCSGQKGLDSAAVQSVEKTVLLIPPMLWDYGILFPFVCCIVEVLLVSFYILELIVCPWFIVIFIYIIKHIILCCWKVGHWLLMTIGCIVCFVGHSRPKARDRSLPGIWVQQ